jgi:hypothetical protein
VKYQAVMIKTGQIIAEAERVDKVSDMAISQGYQRSLFTIKHISGPRL